MKKRNVPADNHLQLTTTTAEQIGRDEYEREIASRVRNFISKKDPEGKKLRCIVLMYGIPLRILSAEMTLPDKIHISRLRKHADDLSVRIRKRNERQAGMSMPSLGQRELSGITSPVPS